MRETPPKMTGTRLAGFKPGRDSKNSAYMGSIRREGMSKDMNPQRLQVEYPSSASKNELNPDWLVGFVDGEGCFHVGISKNNGVRFGYQILPELTVVQHQRDLALLHRIRTFMGCGVVRRNHEDRFCWRVRKLECLAGIIVPFFERHPLRSSKNVDFRKFASVVRRMVRGDHLTAEGFQKIRKIAEEMNHRKTRDVRIKIESTRR